MHLTDAGPMSTGAPSVVQVAVCSELTRGQGDGFADTCTQIAMGDFLGYGQLVAIMESAKARCVEG
jgi:hypothetical protein